MGASRDLHLLFLKFTTSFSQLQTADIFSTSFQNLLIDNGSIIQKFIPEF